MTLRSAGPPRSRPRRSGARWAPRRRRRASSTSVRTAAAAHSDAFRAASRFDWLSSSATRTSSPSISAMSSDGSSATPSQRAAPNGSGMATPRPPARTRASRSCGGTVSNSGEPSWIVPTCRSWSPSWRTASSSARWVSKSVLDQRPNGACGRTRPRGRVGCAIRRGPSQPGEAVQQDPACPGPVTALGCGELREQGTHGGPLVGEETRVESHDPRPHPGVGTTGRVAVGGPICPLIVVAMTPRVV